MGRRSYTVEAVDASFDINGEEFMPANLSLLDIGELAVYADIDVDTAEGLAKLTEFFQLILGDDYERFKALCGRLHMKPAQLLAIVTDIFTDMFEIADFPTQAALPSPDGPPTTKPMLKVVSSNGLVREELLTPQREAELREAVARAAQLEAEEPLAATG